MKTNYFIFLKSALTAFQETDPGLDTKCGPRVCWLSGGFVELGASLVLPGSPATNPKSQLQKKELDVRDLRKRSWCQAPGPQSVRTAPLCWATSFVTRMYEYNSHAFPRL